MLTADKIQDMKEYLNYAFETMLKLWRTFDYGECVHELLSLVTERLSIAVSFPLNRTKTARSSGSAPGQQVHYARCEVLDALAQC